MVACIKSVSTIKKLRDLEQFIAQAGGHIVGIINEYKGVIVKYSLPSSVDFY
jgi:hypothetical protein